MASEDTIFALSSGSPPAAIAVIRISGPRADAALAIFDAGLPAARRASLRSLRDPDAPERILDDALILRFPGPRTATGEDLVELHLHGGRAVVAAIEDRLAKVPGLRRAEPGEFTRRAFANGRIDLAEASGLADLLSAETELQLANARALASGALSQKAESWREAILSLSARVEGVLDFSDEEDTASLDERFADDLRELASDLADWLDAPSVETLREGYRVAIAGPPNSGKSSLFNALIESDAAIATPIAGTTRDVLLRPVALFGVPITFIDMAGLRDDSADSVEQIGIARAREEIARADHVLWLGDEGAGPDGAWEVQSMIDRDDVRAKMSADFRVSAVTGENVPALRKALADLARSALPKPGEVAISRFQRDCISAARAAVSDVTTISDPLIVAEQLRVARGSLDRMLGNTTTEDMLDALFGRFCIGK